MNKTEYRIKDWHSDDEWVQFEYDNYWNDKDVAEIIAKEYFNEDPCNEKDFKCEIVFKDGYTYKVLAEHEVVFQAYRMKVDE